MAPAPSFPQERYQSEESWVCDRRCRAMRKFSAVFWIKNTACLFWETGWGWTEAGGRWRSLHFPILSAIVSQCSKRSRVHWQNTQGSVGNEGNAVKLCRTGKKLCVANCRLGICIISVKMLCFLFPGKESIEGRRSGAAQRAANSLLRSRVPSHGYGQHFIRCCNWIRL